VVNYLKIDVEGEAKGVLRGGGRTLRRTRWLQIEMIGSEVWAHSLLKRIGFRLIDRRGNNYLYSK
ncbi:FkbM family methyltransferase, partial [Pyrobaculum sp.]|uniref:FkbM family methyltransferase n=1 Tax=Pyrobaculum sp. TaxID=2004705 RepID=UPI003D0E6D33